MQADPTSHPIVPPAPLTERGYVSHLDASADYLLYFNANSVVLLPHQHERPALHLHHHTHIAAAAFSHDGRLVASIETKGTLLISEVCPDRLLIVHRYDGVFANAKAISWSADRKRVCIVGDGKGKYGRVIMVETGTNSGEISGVSMQLNACSFRPERPFKLAVGGDGQELKFYDGPPYSYLKSDQAHKGYINQLQYSQKGSWLASVGADKRIVIFDGKTFDKVAEKETAHSYGIYGLDWIDDQHFVTCSSDKFIKIWNSKLEELFAIETCDKDDMSDMKKIEGFLYAVKTHKDIIYSINLRGDILSFKNPLLCEGSRELQKTYQSWRSKVVQVVPYGEDSLVFLGSSGRIIVYSVQECRTKAVEPAGESHGIVMGFLHSQNESRNLYTLLNNGFVKIYSTQTTAENFKDCGFFDQAQMSHIAPWSASHFVAVSGSDLILADWKSSEVVKKVKAADDVTCLASNGTYSIVGTVKGALVLYKQMEELKRFSLKTFKITTIIFIPALDKEASYALIGDSCGNMTLIELTGDGYEAVKGSMGGHSTYITSAQYDEKWIYTISMDGKINLWNRTNLSREKSMEEAGEGGIVCAITTNKSIVVCKDDLITKIVPKIH